MQESSDPISFVLLLYSILGENTSAVLRYQRITRSFSQTPPCIFKPAVIGCQQQVGVLGGTDMERTYNEISIRGAKAEDAQQLCAWWNDGAVMAHAGFPHGLGTTEQEVAAQIQTERDETCRRHIILLRDTAIGEMVYRRLGDHICEIGIKICDADRQNRGLGKIILSLFIEGLFSELGYEKIVLDTDLTNQRAQHVYEQLGFQKVRTNVDSYRDQLGNMRSSVEYELTKQQFVSYL